MRNMKILVLSDSHGKNEGMWQAIRQEEPLDWILHLGDIEGCEQLLQERAACAVEIVKGNVDFSSQNSLEKVLTIAGQSIFLCHGHRYGVEYSRKRLALEAKQKGCTIALYGHTHRPLQEEVEGVKVLNPGSISYPRQEDGRPSYLVMTLEEGKEPEMQIRYR